MPELSKGLQVKLSPSILQNDKRKKIHHMLERIINDDLTGDVINFENSEHHKGWWVRFKYGNILLQEGDVISLDV